MLEEARESAEAFAESLARRVAHELESVHEIQRQIAAGSEEVGDTISGNALWLNAAGDLLEVGGHRRPAHYPPLPEPFDHDTSSLDGDTLAAWSALKSRWAENGTLAASSSGEISTSNIDTLPTPFRELASFIHGSLLIDSGEHEHGVRLLRGIDSSSRTLLPSGIPLAPMSWLKIVESSNTVSDADLVALCEAALDHPSFLTPRFLKQASDIAVTKGLDTALITRYRSAWEIEERQRAFYRGAVRETDPSSWRNRMRWVTWNDDRFLLRSKIFTNSPEQNASAADNVIWICTDEAVRKALHSEALQSQLASGPDYATVDILIANRRAWPDTNTLRSDSQLLVQTIAGVRIGGIDYPSAVEIRIVLDDPARLYARQNIRLGIFGGLLLIAVLAGTTGLVGAWRAFRRQQQLNEMQSNFVSSVTHELRAPIASVRLMAEGLDTGRVSGEGKLREYHRFIVRECARLSSLIENVLDFSRIERDARRYDLEPTDLGKLITGVDALMKPVAADAGVRLAYKLNASRPDEDAPQPHIDGRAIQQALVNLIDNAIKNSPPVGQVEVTITQSTNLTIRVSDAGPGIPVADRRRIFERFYRRGSELRRQTTGVGIGLSIVKHIVDAHRGIIRVDDNENGGSSFVIELPLAPDTSSADER